MSETASGFEGHTTMSSRDLRRQYYVAAYAIVSCLWSPVSEATLSTGKGYITGDYTANQLADMLIDQLHDQRLSREEVAAGVLIARIVWFLERGMASLEAADLISLQGQLFERPVLSASALRRVYPIKTIDLLNGVFEEERQAGHRMPFDGEQADRLTSLIIDVAASRVLVDDNHITVALFTLLFLRFVGARTNYDYFAAHILDFKVGLEMGSDGRPLNTLRLKIFIHGTTNAR